ncbi:MAG: D-alanyl-D-alanine carboxypeptidase [Candidatus Moranbacteria bacterium]|nr:D-alanyl-D-alanine carboxypeptidase [Candidatus Moranbacteria bacterium]
MNIIAFIFLAFFAPAQFFLAGLFLKPQAGSPAQEKVEGATDEKTEESGASFKNSVSAVSGTEAVPNSFGYLPQRKSGYADIEIPAEASVVIDANSGTILHYDKGRKENAIASLTKIMTAVLVMENVKNLDEIVTIDDEDVDTRAAVVGCPSSTSCISERLHPGEKLTVESLLKAMLIDSANDAAIALGKYVGGSQKNFAAMMNKKARDLNLIDSNFCNSTGLDEENCHSSAYDLARIAAYSMKYDSLWEIMRTDEDSVKSIDGKYTHELKNTDKLLGGQVPNCIGGKTGFTYNAGESLMMGATDPETGEHRVVAVILNDNNRWEDMQKLLAWTFDNYEWK